VSEIPWWGLPLVAGVFGVGGAVVALLIVARAERARRRAERVRRWHDDRSAAYVALLAAYERAITRMRIGFAAGVTEPDPMLYLNEVGPALVHVRLVASAPVRNAAVAVHRVLEDLHAQRVAHPNGQSRSFLEMLDHVPLVLHDLERAIRDDLGLDSGPPSAAPPPPPQWRRRVRSVAANLRRPRPDGGAPSANGSARD
jgi:hypothetical protein